MDRIYVICDDVDARAAFIAALDAAGLYTRPDGWTVFGPNVLAVDPPSLLANISHLRERTRIVAVAKKVDGVTVGPVTDSVVAEKVSSDRERVHMHLEAGR